MTRFQDITKMAKASSAAMLAVSLAGCSLGLTSEPPASLLTLSSTAIAPAGTGAQVGGDNTRGAVAVLIPETPAKLNVARVPVAISDTEIAYLQEAFWVEKPARLFRRLLGETLRARGDVFVLDSDDTPTLAAQTLRGTLSEMGYDAPSSSVIVRYDAVRTNGEGGVVETRRFEARENGVLPEAGLVGPALNRVANTVANDVANWMAGAPPIIPAAPAIMEDASPEDASPEDATSEAGPAG